MYIDDGDSKAYKDLEVVKGECIGHVQKRVGSRLQNLKATEKKTSHMVNHKEGKKD